MFEKLAKFINSLNEKGIPLPLIRLKGQPTFTGTLAFISFNVFTLGSIGKVTKLLGEVDLTQTGYMFGLCLAGYLGNKRLTIDGKNITSVLSDNESK